MDLTTDPDRPVANQPTKLQLKLIAPNGNPADGAAVVASLTMPLMDMGKNEAQLHGVGNGIYEGVATFTMTGPWNVVVTVRFDGQTVQDTISLAVRE